MTNRGEFLCRTAYFRGSAAPTNFYAALCEKQNEKTLDNAAAVDLGGGLVGVPITAHGYAAGARVKIEGTTNYNDYFLVDATSTVNQVVIAATFVAETFAGTELIHQAPGPDTNTIADVTQIPVGNGYADGGVVVERSAVGFDIVAEDDALDRFYIQLKNLIYTAAGGPLPISGPGARYVLLTTDEVVIANRQIISVFDLESDSSVSDTQPLTILNAEIRSLVKIK